MEKVLNKIYDNESECINNLKLDLEDAKKLKIQIKEVAGVVGGLGSVSLLIFIPEPICMTIGVIGIIGSGVA